MAAYAAIQDLADRLGWDELAERAAPDARVTGELLRRHAEEDADLASEADADTLAAIARAAERIERDLDAACAELDSRLGGRAAALPIDPVPDVLRTRAVDFAAYAVAGGGRDSDAHIRWRAALDWCDAFAAGRVRLDDDDAAGDAGDADAAGGAEFSGDAPFFSRARLRGAGF